MTELDRQLTTARLTTSEVARKLEVTEEHRLRTAALLNNDTRTIELLRNQIAELTGVNTQLGRQLHDHANQALVYADFRTQRGLGSR